MSTRCNIILGGTQFYHHYDGYPDGVGAVLAKLISNVNAGILPEEYRILSSDGSIEDIAWDVGNYGMLTNHGFDKTYESEPFGLHWDIEYLYIADGDPGQIKLYCLDVNEYIRKQSKDGSAWGVARENSPLWQMSIDDLKRNFCKRKYLMNLPDSEVPLDQRRYLLQKPLTHEEVKDFGIMDRELGWGEENIYGLLRTNSIRSKKSGKLRRLFRRRR